MPLAQPSGKIVVVKTPREADAAVALLMREKIVGFDTETRPNFSTRSRNKVSLIQIATEKTCYLFRLQFIGAHAGLKRLLESDDVLKIGLSLKDDVHSLAAWMPAKLKNVVELQSFVPQFGIAEKSLQKIYAIIFCRKISKSQRLSNWEAPILTWKQKAYAAIDAWACREIYLELLKQKEDGKNNSETA